VKAISAEGCASQKTVFITVISKISIPSAFTPNGDGKNDVFRALYGQDISNVHFVVFDRWGQLVFADNGAHKGWDGKLDGVLQPAGTYVWSFEYKDVSGANRNLKGVVELIR
jgi:gliding motility-associated-like protein